MVLDARPLIFGERFVCLSLCKKHVPWSQLGVESEDHVAGFATINQGLSHDRLEQLMRQVIGEVEIRQIVASDAKAIHPDVRGFALVRTPQAFTFLRLDRLFVHLRLKCLTSDHPTLKHLLPHALTDVRRKDRVFMQPKKEGKNLGKAVGIECHALSPTVF